MTHPMSMPWLDWRSIKDEPHNYDVILYLDADGVAWTGNHPEGCARGMWAKDGGGSSEFREPIMWAEIPLP